MPASQTSDGNAAGDARRGSASPQGSHRSKAKDDGVERYGPVEYQEQCRAPGYGAHVASLAAWAGEGEPAGVDLGAPGAAIQDLEPEAEGSQESAAVAIDGHGEPRAGQEEVDVKLGLPARALALQEAQGVAGRDQGDGGGAR